MFRPAARETTDTSIEQFHSAHKELEAWAPTLVVTARKLPALTLAEREHAVADLLVDLAALDVHMRLDEHVLYPEVATRLLDPLATAPMAYDHLAIRDWIKRLCNASLSDVDELQELLYGLDALIRVHIWKEDKLYLAMLDNPSWPHSEVQVAQ
jgi:hypothetical protein